MESVHTVDMTMLNVADFNRRYYRHKLPLHLTNSTNNWRVDWSPQYLKSKAGHRRVDVGYNDEGTFDYNQSATTGVVKKRSMSFHDAVDLILSNAGSKYYIQQHGIKERLPELLKDVPLPTLLDRWKVVKNTNLWLGGTGCRTPLHHDQMDNFLVQILGKKRLTLFPPDQGENLYPAVGELLPHCSQVNVFCPDKSRFPRYAIAEAHGYDVCLSPGDTLYVPLHWWHAAESLTPALSVNFWWTGVT